MAEPVLRRAANLLLSALPEADFQAIEPFLERVELKAKKPIETPGQRISHVYFVESGMVSIVASEHGNRGTEVGMIGFEGATGCTIALGDDVPMLETFVQIPGWGFRMEASAFRQALQDHPALHELMLRYARVLWIQATSTALTNVNAKLEARLARWLLMMHDRMHDDTITITHEFLAVMLACRRPGVTVTLHVLEGERLIESRRGTLVVLDRDGLARFADGSYGIPEAEYDRLIRPRVRPDTVARPRQQQRSN